MNTLRYAERLKDNSDDQTLEKYMTSSKPTKCKSPERSFQHDRTPQMKNFSKLPLDESDKFA